MAPTCIYEALLGDVEARTHVHHRHLSTYRAFFEGLRVIKRNLGFYDKVNKIYTIYSNYNSYDAYYNEYNNDINFELKNKNYILSYN